MFLGAIKEFLISTLSSFYCLPYLYFSSASLTITLSITMNTHHFATGLAFNITRLSSIVAVIGTYVVEVVDGKDGFAVRCVDVE